MEPLLLLFANLLWKKKMIVVVVAWLMLLEGGSLLGHSQGEFGYEYPGEVPKGDAETGTGASFGEESEAIIGNLEKSQQLLQRASAMPSARVGKCHVQINSAISSIAWVETLLLEDHFDRAADQLTRAKQTISDCNQLLSSSSVDASQAVLFLTRQALGHIDEASSSIMQLASLNPKSLNPESQLPSTIMDTDSTATKPGGLACMMDGTRCPFTTCGQGKGLVKCSIGFASGVTGGLAGRSYVVTSAVDNPMAPQPGTLRYGIGLATTGGVWITFAQSMVIVLKEMLWVKSDTTIDGRGVNATITGRNVVLAGAHNVILHNIQINGMDESDTIHIFAGSSKVWVDHLTSFQAKLGLVSVLQGSTDVTISNSHLSNPNFNMLLGASDADMEDKIMRVTVYRNWFKDSMQRMPHCRWGYCHVINNLYTNWGYYAIGARVHAKVLSEYNVFIASRRAEVTPWFAGAGESFDSTATIQSRNDLYLNGSTFHQFIQFGVLSAPEYKDLQTYPPIQPTSTLATLVGNCAGALIGPQLQRCLLVRS